MTRMWLHPLRLFSVAVALTMVSPAWAQTTAIYYPGWYARQQNPPANKLLQDAINQVKQLCETEERGPVLLSALETLADNLQNTSINLSSWIRMLLANSDQGTPCHAILQELSNQLPLSTPLRPLTRIMPNVPREISKRNWPNRQDDWDQVALWPRVFKPLHEIQDGIADDAMFDPLQPEAGAILQSTANRLNQELRQTTILDMTLSGPQHQRLALRDPQKNDFHVSNSRLWDPEKVGYYKVWIYINTEILQSVETSYKALLQSKKDAVEKAEKANQVPRKIRVPRTGFWSFLGSHWIVQSPTPESFNEDDIRCLGHLIPSTSPWNSRGFVWSEFVEDLKVNLYNDMLRYGADECTKKNPCTIYVIIHPRILTEMTQLWDFQTIPKVLPMEEQP